MKKFKSLLSVMMSMILLCGCGGGASDADTPEAKTTAVQTTSPYPSAGAKQIERFDPDTNFDLELFGVKWSIPNCWKEKTDEDSDSYRVCYQTEDEKHRLWFILTKPSWEPNQTNIKAHAAILENDEYESFSTKDMQIGTAYALYSYWENVNSTSSNKLLNKYRILFSPDNKTLFSFGLVDEVENPETDESYWNDYIKIAQSAEILPVQSTESNDSKTDSPPYSGKTMIESFDPKTNVDFEIGGMRFSIPKDWTTDSSDETNEEDLRNVTYWLSSRSAAIRFSYIPFGVKRGEEQAEVITGIMNSLTNNSDLDYDLEPKDIEIAGKNASYVYASKVPSEKGEFDTYIVLINPDNEQTICALLYERSSLNKSHWNDYMKVLQNAEILSKQTTTTTEKTTTTTTTTTTAPPQNTYEHNECYDVIGTASFTDSINATHIIHKVKAKKNTTVEGTILAYNGNGDVIGKETDTIVLTEGKNNYFEYIFTNSVSNAKLEKSYYVSGDNFMTGERNAVEMVKFSQSQDWLGTTLYVTVKQTGSKIGSLAKYKLLLYNGSKLVDTDFGYIGVHTSKLTGIGSTDVMEVSLFSEAKFNKVEFIYEP